MNRLPYEGTDKVQSILNSDLTIHEKAQQIHRYDYDMHCLPGNGNGIPKASMSVVKIKDILIERER